MTLQEVKQIYKDVFYLEEDLILDIIIATTIATKLKGDPIWLLIVGSSSSGKSELVNSIGKVPFVYPVSSLTENTFLSNMRLSDGKEASLLHQIGSSGMITMKDYTSILAMRPEKREIIVSQMREIYDGTLTKKSGNGKSEEWKGKINWLGAATDSVYLKEAESAGMGRRTINYIMPQQDRIATTRRALQNNSDIAEKRERIQVAFAEYIMDHVQNIPSELPTLTEEFSEQLIEIADFITLIRTPTSRDYKNNLILVPSPEAPMRAFQMFQTLTRILVYIHDGQNMNQIKKIIRKLAFDSIPKQTRLVLDLLAQYSKLTAKGAAQKLRYPTETVRIWLEDINALGVCERESAGGPGPDIWVLQPQYQRIMEEYGGIKQTNNILVDSTSELVTNANEIDPKWVADALNYTDDPGSLKEQQQKSNELFESF